MATRALIRTTRLTTHSSGAGDVLRPGREHPLSRAGGTGGEEGRQMLLVPKQLQRHGMTGAVPYYGGRLTPWHINAIKDQERAQASARPPVRTQQGVLDALTHLWNSGILTPAEFNELRARAGV